MEVDGVIGVLEGVAGQHQNHCFTGIDYSPGTQLLQSRQRDRGSRLATQTFRAQFGFGDGNLGLGYVQAPSAGLLDDPRRLAP